MSDIKVNEKTAGSAVNDAVGGSAQDEQRKKAFEEALMMAILSAAANTKQLKLDPNNA